MTVHTAQVRLEALYRVKEGYSLEELAPYVQDLVGVAGAPKTIQELLALHTKIDSSNGLFTCTSK